MASLAEFVRGKRDELGEIEVSAAGVRIVFAWPWREFIDEATVVTVKARARLGLVGRD